MQDKIYQSVKRIAIGILLGYFGKYALNWLKTKRDQEKTVPLQDDYLEANEY